MTIQNQDVETTVDVYKTTTALVSPMIEDPPIAQREHNENNLTMEKNNLFSANNKHHFLYVQYVDANHDFQIDEKSSQKSRNKL